MIQVRNLTKRFGSFVAVDDLSFDIRQGETFALLGPNGSGKTTTLKCIVGLSFPDSGRIQIAGLDTERSPKEARQILSYLPQRVGFHENLTAREILTFFCRLRGIPSSRIEDLLKGSRFDFNGFADKPVREFSGGMVQRLGLAVACLPDAPVLVLDEPTINLDPEGVIRFREFLADLKQAGKTIVFSSHMLVDAEQLADRVAILVGGKLVALESTERLRRGYGYKMRLSLTNPDQRLVEAAILAGAEQAALQGNSLMVLSRPENQLSILRAIESAGGEIICFTTHELPLEDIYLGYMHGESMFRVP
jgi:ABC-type multidrug transport system ATPase subunit